MKAFERDDNGIIHDRVIISGAKERPRGKLSALFAPVYVAVIAGDDRTDNVSMQLNAHGVTTSMLMTAKKARRLGELLIAAADDTMSRRPALKAVP